MGGVGWEIVGGIGWEPVSCAPSILRVPPASSLHTCPQGPTLVLCTCL